MAVVLDACSMYVGGGGVPACTIIHSTLYLFSVRPGQCGELKIRTSWDGTADSDLSGLAGHVAK